MTGIMKRIIIIREESAEKKFLKQSVNHPAIISPRARGSMPSQKLFFANRKLVSQKTLFRLTPSLNCFTQHRHFWMRSILNRNSLR